MIGERQRSPPGVGRGGSLRREFKSYRYYCTATRRPSTIFFFFSLDIDPDTAPIGNSSLRITDIPPQRPPLQRPPILAISPVTLKHSTINQSITTMAKSAKIVEIQMQLALDACRNAIDPNFSDITRQFPPVNRQTLHRRFIGTQGSWASTNSIHCQNLLGALLWGKWGLFEPQGIQTLKSSAVWCNGVARGVS